jgi:cell division initiation protein
MGLLTPQEVADKKFGKAFMGGYEMSAVDDFLEVLTDDYTSLYKESALLKNKIRVLVDKLEEYRSVDESMRKTWREAQKNAEGMIAQAKTEAQKILSDTEAHAGEKMSEIAKKIELEEYRLNTAQQQTITFVNSLREIYQRQIEQLSVIPSTDPPPQTVRQTIEAAANQAAFEIEQSVMAQIEGDYADHSAPQPPQPEPADTELPQPPDINVIHTREGGFYGPDGNELDDDVIKLLWDPEQDTEVPRPREDGGFPDLESQFGAGVEIGGKKK